MDDEDVLGRKKREEEEEAILALQRERKNQYVSFKKFGEFRARSTNNNGKGGGKGGTALGWARGFISLLVFGLYWSVDAVDGRCACLLFVASYFVVSVHPAFTSHAKIWKG